jgi:hypothetical protein
MAKTILPLIVMTTAPTVSDDASAGYFVGQEWQNTTTGLRYACNSVAIGAAVWNLVAVGANPTFTSISASTSAGLLLKNSNGTTVATLGAGPGTGVTFAGGVNMQALGCTTVTSSGTNGQLLLQDGATASGRRISIFNAAGNANGYLQFEGYSTAYGRMNADGSLVWGTDPGGSELLRVGGSGRFSGTIFAVGGSNDSEAAPAIRIGHRKLISFANSSGDPTSFIYPMSDDSLGIGAGNNTRVVIKTNGSVLIGTDPGGNELFRVNGGIRHSGNIVTDSSATHGIQLGPTVAPAWVRYNTSGNLELIPRAGYAAIIGNDPGGSELVRVGGSMKLGGVISSLSGGEIANYIAINRIGSDAIGDGPYLYLGESGSPTLRQILQLSSAGHLDFWAYGSSAWNRRMRLENGGALTISGKLSANSAAASSTLTGNTVAQVISWLQTVFA